MPQHPSQDHDQELPRVRQTVLDTDDPRRLAEFYRRLLGLEYRPGDEPPPAGEPDPRGKDWLVLRGRDDHGLAFQMTDRHVAATWPEEGVPQQLHLDMTVSSADMLRRQQEVVLALGGRVLYDRFDDPDEPLLVFADPAGHPFCIFAG